MKKDLFKQLEANIGQEIDFDVVERAAQWGVMADYDFFEDWIEDRVAKLDIDKLFIIYSKDLFTEYLKHFEVVDKSQYCLSGLDDVLNVFKRETIKRLRSYIPPEYEKRYSGGVSGDIITDLSEGYFCRFDEECYIYSFWWPEEELFYYNFLYETTLKDCVELTDEQMEKGELLSTYYKAQMLSEILKNAIGGIDYV